MLSISRPSFNRVEIVTNSSALPLSLQIEPYHLENMATVSTSAIPSGTSQTLSATGLRLQLPKEEWQGLKPLIQRLYIEENRTFLEIRDFLAKSYKFRPT
jgi:hypothetical protein